MGYSMVFRMFHWELFNHIVANLLTLPSCPNDWELRRNHQQTPARKFLSVWTWVWRWHLAYHVFHTSIFGNPDINFFLTQLRVRVKAIGQSAQSIFQSRLLFCALCTSAWENEKKNWCQDFRGLTCKNQLNHLIIVFRSCDFVNYALGGSVRENRAEIIGSLLRGNNARISGCQWVKNGSSEAWLSAKGGLNFFKR